MRTCARLTCRVVLTRPNQKWCGDACRKAAGRDPIQGDMPPDWAARSKAFWHGVEQILSRPRIVTERRSGARESRTKPGQEERAA